MTISARPDGGNHANIQDFAHVKILTMLQDIMHEIRTQGPVEAVMEVYTDFFMYASGVYQVQIMTVVVMSKMMMITIIMITVILVMFEGSTKTTSTSKMCTKGFYCRKQTLPVGWLLGIMQSGSLDGVR